MYRIYLAGIITATLLLTSGGEARAQKPGTFSGVTVKNLLDTPNLKTLTLVNSAGAGLLKLCSGCVASTHAGTAVVLAQTGFSVKASFNAPQGNARLKIICTAPNTSTDSYWVTVDGVQSTAPLYIPSTPALGSRELTLKLTKSGAHTVELTLREKPGAVLSSLVITRQTVAATTAPMTAALAKSRPRLMLTAKSVPLLKARLLSSAGKTFYKLPGLLTSKAPAYKPGARNGGAFRNLPIYALGQLLSPDPKQLAAIEGWLQVATTYGTVGVDLDAGYFLEGVALTYDWLHGQLGATLRAKVKDLITDKAREVFNASVLGKSGGGLSFQQNHFWYSNFALAMGAAAIYDEVPEAQEWLAWAWDRLERVAISFSPDGSFHEGPSYWDFSMPVLYMFVEIYEQLSGVSAPGIDAGLKGQGQFRFQHLYPGLKLTAALEDTKKTAGRPPARLMLWEARRFQDKLTMGLAEALATAPSTNQFHQLWLDEKLAKTSPTSLPLARHYDDVGTVFTRTSWANDATFAAFVSRPLGGKKWAGLCKTFSLGGTGHNHPAQGHFVLFGKGEVLAGDPGYTYEKRTRNHNTILVDGKGQLGDSEMWPKPTSGTSKVTGFLRQGQVTIAAGEAASAYPAALGVSTFERFLVMTGPDLMVTYDRLAASKAVTFSWLLHHYGKQTVKGGRFSIVRNQAQLTVTPLRPAGYTDHSVTYRPQYIHPTRDITPTEPDVNMLELRNAKPTAATSFMVALQVNSAGATPDLVKEKSTSAYHALEVAGTLVVFNPQGGKMTVPLPWGNSVKTTAKVLVARGSASSQQLVVWPKGTIIPPPTDQPTAKLDGGPPPKDKSVQPKDKSVQPPDKSAPPLDKSASPLDKKTSPQKDKAVSPQQDKIVAPRKDKGAPPKKDLGGDGPTVANEEGGCSVSEGAAPTDGWLLLLLCLGFMRARRALPLHRR